MLSPGAGALAEAQRDRIRVDPEHFVGNGCKRWVTRPRSRRQSHGNLTDSIPFGMLPRTLLLLNALPGMWPGYSTHNDFALWPVDARSGTWAVRRQVAGKRPTRGCALAARRDARVDLPILPDIAAYNLIEIRSPVDRLGPILRVADNTGGTRGRPIGLQLRQAWTAGIGTHDDL